MTDKPIILDISIPAEFDPKTVVFPSLTFLEGNTVTNTFRISGPLAKAIAAAIDVSTCEEREACALEAENFSKPYDIDWWLNSTKKEVSVQMCIDIAAAIRNGGAA